MTDDELIARIMAASPERLEAVAEGLQSLAFRRLADGDTEGAELGEESAAYFRQLAEEKRG